MDSVEDFARRWAKEEEVEVDTLSKLVKLILSFVNKRISILCATMSTRCKSVFDNPEFAAELVDLHDNYVIVPADKASNNIVFVCKTYYINCLREELGLNASKGNPIYTCTSLSKEETLGIHKTVLLFFGISTADKDLDLPELYWIVCYIKIHINDILRVRLRVQPSLSLSQILTRILAAIRDGLQKYCDSSYARSGVNQL